MFTIKLKNLKIFAYHGLYAEEKILGNWFLINVEVKIAADKEIIEIEDTVNYVAIYEIVKSCMLLPTELLESLVQKIALQIEEFDTRIKYILVEIEKAQPPIPNFEGSVAVSFQKTIH